MNIPFVYPNYEADMNLTYANLKGVSFELYRLNISPASSLIRGNLKEETLIQNYGTKVSSRYYALPSTPITRSVIRYCIIHCPKREFTC